MVEELYGNALAAAQLLEGLAAGSDRAAVFTFDKEVAERHPFAPVGPAQVSAVARLHAFGSTSLYDAALATSTATAHDGQARRGVVLAVSRLAKWKTTLQMDFVFALLAIMSLRAGMDPDPAYWARPVGWMDAALRVALWITTLLTLGTGLDYAWKMRAAFAPAGSAR